MRSAVDILGIPVHQLTLDRLLGEVVHAARERRCLTVGYVNAHVLDVALGDSRLSRFLREIDLVYADGAGAVLASRLLGDPLPGRMTGADWIWDLAAVLASEELSLYMVGGRPGVAETAARRLLEVAPALRIAGTHHGYFDRGGPENDAVLQDIAHREPHVLLVGLGTPLQEHWVAANRDRLGDRVVWVTGAVMDHAAGRVPRAPRWMRELHLEWLFRFASEPRRLAPRYLAGNARFAARLVMQVLSTRGFR